MMMPFCTKLLLLPLLSQLLCFLVNIPVANAVKGNSKRLSKPLELAVSKRPFRILLADDETDNIMRKHSKKCKDDVEDVDLRDHKDSDDEDCSPTAMPAGSEGDTPAPVAPTPSPVTPAPASDSTTGQSATTSTSEACKAAADGRVYETDRSISVKYIYELVTYAASDMEQVAFAVDKAVHRFLLDSLIDCDDENRRRGLAAGRRQLTAMGVGPGDADTIEDGSCANIAPLDPSTQVCYNMEGSMDLFLDDASTWTDEEGAFIVYQQLKNAFNTPTRPLQDGRFVDPRVGILDLYFVRGLNAEDVSSSTGGSRASPGGGGISTANMALVISGSILVVLAAILLVAYKRHKATSRAVKEVSAYPTDDDDTAGTAELRVASSDDLEGGGGSNKKSRSCLPVGGGSTASVDLYDYGYEMDFYRTQSDSEQILRDLGSMALTEEMMQDNRLGPVFISPRQSDESSVMTPSQYPERKYVISNTVQL